MGAAKARAGVAAEGTAADVGEEGAGEEERGATGVGLAAVAGVVVVMGAEAGAAMAVVGERAHQIEGGEQVSAC